MQKKLKENGTGAEQKKIKEKGTGAEQKKLKENGTGAEQKKIKENGTGAEKKKIKENGRGAEQKKLKENGRGAEQKSSGMYEADCLSLRALRVKYSAIKHCQLLAAFFYLISFQTYTLTSLTFVLVILFERGTALLRKNTLKIKMSLNIYLMDVVKGFFIESTIYHFHFSPSMNIGTLILLH